jgi:hypothetical protein
VGGEEPRHERPVTTGAEEGVSGHDFRLAVMAPSPPFMLGRLVALVCTADRGNEEARADAHLFAAAGDLLDACEEAEEVLATVCAEDSWRSADRALEAVRAAILKAKGG